MLCGPLLWLYSAKQACFNRFIEFHTSWSSHKKESKKYKLSVIEANSTEKYHVCEQCSDSKNYQSSHI